MLRPHTINGFTFGVKPSLEYVAREDASGIEKTTRIATGLGGYYELASDGRVAVIAADCSQGKSQPGDDLVMATFDFASKNFVNFPVAEKFLFHAISGAANPNWLWLKNGGGNSAYPADPGASIGRYTFLSTTEIEWVTLQSAGNYRRWRRAFNPLTGLMGPIVEQPPAWTDPSGVPSWL